ncbi:uncharacterized protein LOC119740782 [Patiria miniata]|uniref:PHD-type domain-containing protein n=1 Tax=Patiria miniata TaxID=46514 RepID=A0A914B824_PATMI|nr:uncharacterized protein LOC119740782 [Patiria miniata]
MAVRESTVSRLYCVGETCGEEIIHGFLEICSQRHPRAYIMQCFCADKWANDNFEWLFTKKRFTTFDWVLLPINVDNQHWMLMVANPREQTIAVLNPTGATQNIEFYLECWRRFMRHRSDECTEKLNDWKQVTYPISLQHENSSCDVFILMYAEAILAKKPQVIMRQQHVPMYRRYIKDCIVHNTITAADGRCACSTCCQPKTRTLQWIQCDNCDLWFHFECVDLSNVNLHLDRYYCADCTATGRMLP